MKLSINLNKIALLRNSRGSNNPDIAEYAITALEENILGHTVHPRPDNRHITYDDLICIKNLTDKYNKEFNIEGNPQEVASCLLYTSPSPRDATLSRMPSSA